MERAINLRHLLISSCTQTSPLKISNTARWSPQVLRACDPRWRAGVEAGGNVEPGHPMGGNSGEQQQAPARPALRRPEHPGGDDAAHHQCAGGRGKREVAPPGKGKDALVKGWGNFIRNVLDLV